MQQNCVQDLLLRRLSLGRVGANEAANSIQPCIHLSR